MPWSPRLSGGTGSGVNALLRVQDVGAILARVAVDDLHGVLLAVTANVLVAGTLKATS